MKKGLLYGIIAVVVLAVAVGAVIAMNKGGDTSDNKSSSTAADSYKTVSACDILTLTEAKQLLGDTATAGSNGTGDTENDDIKVSTCTYSKTGATIKDIATLTLLVRSPKSKAGAESNMTPFDSGKPSSAMDVNGYGEAAYWNPELGQLNILTDNNWLIITNLKGTRPDQATQADAEAAAKLILAKM